MFWYCAVLYTVLSCDPPVQYWWQYKCELLYSIVLYCTLLFDIVRYCEGLQYRTIYLTILYWILSRIVKYYSILSYVLYNTGYILSCEIQVCHQNCPQITRLMWQPWVMTGWFGQQDLSSVTWRADQEWFSWSAWFRMIFLDRWVVVNLSNLREAWLDIIGKSKRFRHYR